MEDFEGHHDDLSEDDIDTFDVKPQGEEGEGEKGGEGGEGGEGVEGEDKGKKKKGEGEGEEEEEEEGEEDEGGEEETIESLKARATEAEKQAKGLYAEAKKQRERAQEAEDRANRAGDDTGGTGGSRDAPFGWHDEYDRPKTKEEWESEGFTKRDASLLVQGIENRYRKKFDDQEAKHREDIESIEMKFMEREIVKTNKDWAKIKERGLAAIENMPEVKVAYKHMPAERKIETLMMFGKEGKTAKPTKDEIAEAEERGRQKALDEIAGKGGKGGTGAGAGGAAGAGKKDEEYDFPEGDVPEDIFNSWSDKKRKAYLMTQG